MIISINSIGVIKDGHQIIKYISFDLSENEIIAVVGGSGIGKTTILRVIGGIEKDYSGDIVKHNNSKCSIVFQEFDQLFPWKTLRENIELPLKLKNGSKDRKNKVDEIIDFLKLREHENKYPYQLSGGMKQRTAIGRALIQDSNFLIMDEPFGSLDANVRADLQNEIIKIVEDKMKEGIIFVTHDIEEALYISDKIFLIKKNFTTEMIENRFKALRNSKDHEYLNMKEDIINKIK